MEIRSQNSEVRNRKARNGDWLGALGIVFLVGIFCFVASSLIPGTWHLAPALRAAPPTNVTDAIVVAAGTVALPTSAITSGSCTSCTSASCSGGTFTISSGAVANVASTDTVKYTPNADPTSTAGYGASSSGAVLSVYAWPSSGAINFKVCNSTGSSITPGSLTLNLEVTR